MHYDPMFAAMQADHRVRTLIAEAERFRLLACLRKQRKQRKQADARRAAPCAPVARPVTG